MEEFLDKVQGLELQLSDIVARREALEKAMKIRKDLDNNYLITQQKFG